jgi:hypothetical protein
VCSSDLYVGKWLDALFHVNVHQIIFDEEITRENLASFPSENLYAQHAPLTTPFSAMLNTHSPGPFSDHRNVTNRPSTNTNATSNTYQWNTRRNVKISISDYPKFSGKAKDWTIFERKFTTVAASQGFSYILSEEDSIPVTKED